MIKDFNFSARESIAWIRVCRPGSVIGPQQLFLVSFDEQYNQIRASQRIHEPETPREPPRQIPTPPKSARILFVPFKGCPLPVDNDEEPESARPISRRPTRQSSRAPRMGKLFKNRGQQFMAMHALQMNVLHPQPRKINQKQPYWKTVYKAAYL